MTVALLPRLVPSHLERLVGQLPVDGNASRRPPVVADQQKAVRYGAVGGQQVDRQVIAELHSGLTRIAKDCGFPGRGDQSSRARFDAVAARTLAMHPALESGEALRNDFWAFMAIVLLPDVALWRFPPKNKQVPRDRLAGGVRNVFQRLWLRGRALDRGPDSGNSRWELLNALSEDALVQITERPAVGGHARLARLVAEAWVRTGKRLGREKMENVMRLAVKRIRLRNEILVLAVLPDDALMGLIEKEFNRAVSNLRLG